MVKDMWKTCKKEIKNWGWKDWLYLYVIIVLARMASHFVSYVYTLWQN